MTAKATRRYRPILEAMNGGMHIPGFAAGGPVSAANSSGAPLAPSFHVTVINQTSTPVSARVEEAQGKGPGRHMNVILSDQVGHALTQKGGGASRALRGHYGVGPKGTVR